MLWVLVQLVIAQAPVPQCISLAQSTHCTELKEYSIAAFEGVANAQQFDLYLNANAAYNYGDNCPSWRSAQNSEIRYSKSLACALAVHLSTVKNLCNAGLPTPKPICQSSIDMAFDDVKRQLQAVWFLFNFRTVPRKLFSTSTDYSEILQTITIVFLAWVLKLP
jgi:hypothetical protein